MNTSLKLAVGALGIAVVALLISLFGSNEGGRLGSIEDASSGYQSTTTRSIPGSSLANGQILSLGQGILGSVVITGAGAGVINLYDATSTITNSQFGTTTLVTIPASAAAGTYVFTYLLTTVYTNSR